MISKKLGARFPPPSKGLKRPSSGIYDDDIDPEDIGIETEAEKQMKVLLQKQLNTKISVKDQFAQHKKFVTPSTYNSLTELIKGKCSLEKFKEIEKNEEVHQELQRCGLSEEEIKDYLEFKTGKKSAMMNPTVWNEYMNQIESRIKKHNEELMQPQLFTNVKKLTRHEMELEKTLYAGCADKSKLAPLVVVEDTVLPTEVDSAFNHIKNLSEKLLENFKKKKKQKSKITDTIETENLNVEVMPDDIGQNSYDPNIHHVIVPLEESEVAKKRLSIEEIKSIPRFENYSIGTPSKTLYLKNLHPKITAHELRSVFSSFEEENKSPINYKICSGRMKGQAFVHFNDVKVSEKALHYANGYMLREKPIIIEFGRKS
ncbi:RNA-binding protein 41-like [Uloborus diversus]|uniref:RNA-binding protein 41-like n=1 Tax=Uloborus diversus TaxID=327109 RepID=UPI0024095DF8|nr:RNA-binding protein 41-like [Uloborus diversus]